MNRFGVLNLLIAIGLVASSYATDCRADGKFIKECCSHDNLLTKEIMDKCEDLKDSTPNPTEEPEGPGGTEGPGGPGGPGGPRRGPKHNLCYKECLVNATGVMSNNELNEDKLRSYEMQALGENSELSSTFHRAFVKCFNKAKEFRAKMGKDHPPPPMPPGECKPSSAMLLECVEMETAINCPASDWKDVEECNTKRQSFKTDCKHPHPHPHPHPHH